MREGVLREQEDARGVDRDDLVEYISVESVDWPIALRPVDTCEVVEDVEPFEERDGVLHCGGDLVFGSDVRWDSDRGRPSGTELVCQGP
jgi:hypothetical protein